MQQIGVQHCSGFRTFNVRNTHDHGVSLDRIVDWIESAGHRVERVPDHAEWFSRFAAGLEALPDQQRSQSSYPVLEAYRYPLTSPAQTDSRCFEAAIRGLPVGIEAPLLTEAFVHKCLRDLTRLGLG
jgi:fatty acid CoA ligase FadD9